ncbi:hypothetical protein KR96_24720 [Ralstonia solanacearum]|nr:hypothetical protein KR96_24720 [Ralstonia solanacearum]KFX81253.1 hypothetical protein KR99_24560 [Ralstonia solanacearum]
MGFYGDAGHRINCCVKIVTAYGTQIGIDLMLLVFAHPRCHPGIQTDSCGLSRLCGYVVQCVGFLHDRGNPHPSRTDLVISQLGQATESPGRWQCAQILDAQQSRLDTLG